jgi:hypothetical protein
VRSGGRRAKNDHRRRIEELPAVVFADSEYIHAHLIRMFDLLD